MTTLGLWDRLRHALGHYPSTAREWAVRVQSADVARHELLALDEWLKADPRNAEDYARVNKIAHLGLKLRDYPQERARLTGYAKLRTEAGFDSERLRRGRRWRLVTAGAAAGVVVALAVLLASDLSALSGRYAAGRGEQRQVVLEDGSRIVVNTDSEVAVRFHEFERSVQLVRGEAFFEVAKDAARPFVVRTGRAEVRAVGTKFSVRRNDSDTEVVVTEGRVRVVREGKSDNQTPPASPIQLVPGNLVHVSATAAAASPRAVRLRPPPRAPPKKQGPNPADSLAPRAGLPPARTPRAWQNPRKQPPPAKPGTTILDSWSSRNAKDQSPVYGRSE